IGVKIQKLTTDVQSFLSASISKQSPPLVSMLNDLGRHAESVHSMLMNLRQNIQASSITLTVDSLKYGLSNGFYYAVRDLAQQTKAELTLRADTDEVRAGFQNIFDAIQPNRLLLSPFLRQELVVLAQAPSFQKAEEIVRSRVDVMLLDKASGNTSEKDLFMRTLQVLSE